MLTQESITGGERKMVGSVMFVVAESFEKAHEIIVNDIYYTAGVVYYLKYLLTG